MAKATPKITLSASRDIPFNQLVLSQANVRRIKRGQTIEDLAVDIARRGLLQSLNVRPVLDADSAETGMFEIPAGARLGELETALAAFEDRPAVFDRDQVVNAGAFVSVGHDGSLSVERGYVRPEDLEAIRGSHDDEATNDQAEADGAAPATVITIAGQTADEDDAAQDNRR